MKHIPTIYRYPNKPISFPIHIKVGQNENGIIMKAGKNGGVCSHCKYYATAACFRIHNNKFCTDVIGRNSYYK